MLFSLCTVLPNLILTAAAGTVLTCNLQQAVSATCSGPVSKLGLCMSGLSGKSPATAASISHTTRLGAFRTAPASWLTVALGQRHNDLFYRDGKSRERKWLPKSMAKAKRKLSQYGGSSCPSPHAPRMKHLTVGTSASVHNGGETVWEPVGACQPLRSRRVGALTVHSDDQRLGVCRANLLGRRCLTREGGWGAVGPLWPCQHGPLSRPAPSSLCF